MPKGVPLTPAQLDHYWTLRAQGLSMNKASKECGFGLEGAKRIERVRRATLNGLGAEGKNTAEAKSNMFRTPKNAPDWAVPPERWPDAARDAIEDRTGVLFAKRYLGMELSRWQQIMWQTLQEGWESPDREYLCVNAPPGLGKSTLLVMFAAKLTVEDRAIRGLFMSRAYSLAERNTLRLRRVLERTVPFVDATSTLSLDFGRFRPRVGELWRRNEFIVEQSDGSPVEEKEPTWAAFGFDAEWLGNRLDILIGDDLDSSRTVRSMNTVEGNREVFDNELEPRVEAGGLMCIAQQRLGAFDFSAHALGKRILPDDDGVTEDPDGEAMYRHIVFKAHYEDLCQGVKTHVHGAPSWPDGCLLDSRRLGYRDMRRAMRNRRTFELVYQQNDMVDESGLVQRIWLDGGTDATGHHFPGCWDRDRGVWELPGTVGGMGNTLAGDVIGVVTVDPSPSNFWAVQAWAVHPASEQRFLLDQARTKMEAPDFLDWSSSLNDFTGLAEDWVFNFRKLGVALAWVIVEINAAQRFMLQYEHFQRWQRTRGIEVIAHSTQRNKADPEFGVQMLAPRYAEGKVRLPGKHVIGIREHSVNRLVNEILRYPNSATTDCVMAQWFLEHNYAKLYLPGRAPQGAQWRPSWLRKTGS